MKFDNHCGGFTSPGTAIAVIRSFLALTAGESSDLILNNFPSSKISRNPLNTFGYSSLIHSIFAGVIFTFTISMVLRVLRSIAYKPSLTLFQTNEPVIP